MPPRTPKNSQLLLLTAGSTDTSPCTFESGPRVLALPDSDKHQHQDPPSLWDRTPAPGRDSLVLLCFQDGGHWWVWSKQHLLFFGSLLPRCPRGTILGPCPVPVWHYKCPKILGSNLMYFFYWSYDVKIIQNGQTEKFGRNTGLLSHLWSSLKVAFSIKPDIPRKAKKIPNVILAGEADPWAHPLAASLPGSPLSHPPVGFKSGFCRKCSLETCCMKPIELCLSISYSEWLFWVKKQLEC